MKESLTHIIQLEVVLTDEKQLRFGTHLHEARNGRVQQHSPRGCHSWLRETHYGLRIVPELNHTPACLKLSTKPASSAVVMVTKVMEKRH